MRTLPHVDVVLARASIDIAKRLFPRGFDIVADSIAPDTFPAVLAHYNRTGHVAVSGHFMDATRKLFSTIECWEAFNAWHDFSHIRTCGSFDMAGERLVNDCQIADLEAWAASLPIAINPAALDRARACLTINNVGRLEHWLHAGEQPSDLRQFAFGYLASLHMSAQPAPVVVDQYPREAREWAASYFGGMS